MSGTAPVNPLGSAGNLELAREETEDAQTRFNGNQQQATPLSGSAAVQQPGMVAGQGRIGTGPSSEIAMSAVLAPSTSLSQALPSGSHDPDFSTSSTATNPGMIVREGEREGGV